MNTKLLYIGTALLLVVVFVVAVMLESGGRGGGAPAPDRPLAGADPSLLVRPGSPTLGRPDAKVTLVEFLDPACETCATFYPEVKRLLATHPERLRLVTRHVPFHPGSDAVVALLEAARLQGKYWEALEALLAGQAKWVVNHQALPEQALAVLAGAGFDAARLKADSQRDDVRARVAQDLADAKALKVVKTPEYFVNGKPLPSFGLDQLKALVAEALRS
jgi:protein-disulfide isomerase